MHTGDCEISGALPEPLGISAWIGEGILTRYPFQTEFWVATNDEWQLVEVVEAIEAPMRDTLGRVREVVGGRWSLVVL